MLCYWHIIILIPGAPINEWDWVSISLRDLHEGGDRRAVSLPVLVYCCCAPRPVLNELSIFLSLLSLAIVAPACQDNVTIRLAWMSMKFDRRICNNCSIVIQLEAEVTADGRIWDEVVRKPEVLNPEATTSFRLSRFHWMAINRQRIRRGLSLSLNVWLLIYSRGVLWGAGMWTSGESSILFMILLHWETAALIFPIYCPNDWDTLSKVTISS